MSAINDFATKIGLKKLPSLVEVIIFVIVLLLTNLLSIDWITTLVVLFSLLSFHFYRSIQNKLYKILLVVFAVILFIYSLLRIYFLIFPKIDKVAENEVNINRFRESLDLGIITPSNEPVPNINIPLSPKDLIILLGKTTVVARINEDSCQIIVKDEIPYLTIKKNIYGLFVDALIFDESGILACTIKNNVIIKNLNNYSTIVRPDAHTFQIKDSKDRLVLYIKYLNPTTISLIGTFFLIPNITFSINDSTVSVNIPPKINSIFYLHSNIHVIHKGRIFDIDVDEKLSIGIR